MKAAIIILAGAALLAAASISLARAEPPPGMILDPAVHEWFERQRSMGGIHCCALSDGHLVEDEDWRVTTSGYEVRIHDEWFAVPADATRDPVGGPNPTGRAIAWYREFETGAGERNVRFYCFTPGTMY